MEKVSKEWSFIKADSLGLSIAVWPSDKAVTCTLPVATITSVWPISVSILKEEDKNKVAFRLCLSEQIGVIVKSAMMLLGVNVPDRM